MSVSYLLKKERLMNSGFSMIPLKTKMIMPGKLGGAEVANCDEVSPRGMVKAEEELADADSDADPARARADLI